MTTDERAALIQAGSCAMAAVQLKDISVALYDGAPIQPYFGDLLSDLTRVSSDLLRLAEIEAAQPHR